MPGPAISSDSVHNALSRKVEADAGGASLVCHLKFNAVEATLAFGWIGAYLLDTPTLRPSPVRFKSCTF